LKHTITELYELVQKMFEMLEVMQKRQAEHDTAIALLQNHDCDRAQRLEVLENRERESAISRAQERRETALIAALIAALPTIIIAIVELLKVLR